MDEYSEIYFLDDEDVRNAPRDHRKDHRKTVAVVRRPTGSGDGAPVRRRARAVIAQPATVVEAAAIEAPEKKLFANLTASELVELAAQLLAAIMPLPGAPTAQGQVETDVANLITYQGALALHAKRDEQLRTIGSLVSKVVS